MTMLGMESSIHVVCQPIVYQNFDLNGNDIKKSLPQSTTHRSSCVGGVNILVDLSVQTRQSAMNRKYCLILYNLF
jgi:hypothetical protein